MASTECAQSDGSDDDNKPVHVITKEDIARIMAEPPPPGSHIVISPLGDESVQGYPGDVEPRSHGVHEIRDVVEILEGVEISCCMISEPALIYYGTGRLMMDWLMCIPTDQLDAAAQLFRDKPEQFEPFRPSAMKRAMGIEDYFPRFKFVGLRLFFILMFSQAHNIPCKAENIEYNQMGLPYPKLHIYAQSLLDTRNFVDLEDLIDGMNLTLEWGKENLNLEGTIDTDWGRWKADLTHGGHATEDQIPRWFTRPDARRETWESRVSDEAKKMRQGFSMYLHMRRGFGNEGRRIHGWASETIVRLTRMVTMSARAVFVHKQGAGRLHRIANADEEGSCVYVVDRSQLDLLHDA